MKKRVSVAVMIAFVVGFMMFGSIDEARADVGLVGDLVLGGDLILGGAVGGGYSGFAFGIEPMIAYHPIDNLYVFGRLPFWEGYFAGGGSVHFFPFIFGARYYFPVASYIRVFAGGGLGFTISHVATAHFALDFHGGVEFEVIDNLGIDTSFDIFLPVVASTTAARFGLTGGIKYYLPL